jgi:hypothetical protein
MSEQNQSRSEESLRHEYTEVVQNIRHYSNLRFAIFTIFIAVMGGVGFVAFGKGQFETHAALVARIAGVPVIALFWLYQERTGYRYNHAHSVAVNLERALNYTELTSVSTQFPPGPSLISRLFFFLLTLAWSYAAFAVPLDH